MAFVCPGKKNISSTFSRFEANLADKAKSRETRIFAFAINMSVFIIVKCMSDNTV